MHWGADGISALMVLLTGIVAFTGVIVSWRIDDRPKEYFVLFMTLLTGVYGTFLSLDIFFLFFFYELAVLPMYLLIAVWGSTNKEYGAMKLVLYLVAGSVLVWIAIIAIYVEAGIGSFDLLALQEADFARDFQQIFFPLIMIGFGVLAGLWALPHLVARWTRRRPHRRQHAARRRPDEARCLRHHPPRHDPPPRGARLVADSLHLPRHHQRGLRRDVGDGAEGPQVRHRLLQRGPHGTRPHRPSPPSTTSASAAPCFRCSPTAS